MGRRGRGDCNIGGPGGLQEVTYAVPADKCGLVIGKGKEQVLIGWSVTPVDAVKPPVILLACIWKLLESVNAPGLIAFLLWGCLPQYKNNRVHQYEQS